MVGDIVMGAIMAGFRKWMPALPTYNTQSTTPASTPQPALRIALIGYRSHPHVGGQGIYIKQLACALHALGHQVTVISGPPYPALPDEITLIKLPSLNLYEVPNHVTALRFKHLSSLADTYEWWSMLTGGFAEPYCFGRRLKAFLKKHPSRFDIVHDNQSLCTALLKLKLPTVATVHHPITRDKEHAIAQASNWLHRWGARRWYSFLTMQARVTRKLSHVVTVSQASREDIAACFGRPVAKTQVIFNGINTALFKPLDGVEKQPNTLLATCSSDQPLKGFKVLLNAYAELLKKHPDLQLTVIGKLQTNGESEKHLHHLKLQNRVLFRSGLSDDEMVAAYNAATVFICPSLYEGFGLPAAEAMSCGTAVIVSDGGALPEVVGNAGLVVPAGDSLALARAAGQLLQDDDHRQDLEKRGRERACSVLSWGKVAEDYVELYRQAIAQRQISRPTRASAVCNPNACKPSASVTEPS